MSAGVYITFDAECGMGGAWGNEVLRPVSPARGMMGQFGRRQLGLPLIVDILSGAGVPATFFVEAFVPEQGYPDDVEPICRFLVDRGQDVQLHVHPNHWHYGLHRQNRPYVFSDDFSRLAPDERLFLLEEGSRRLEAWTGRRPIAFRAGNMAASEESLQQVAAAGLRIDSSYCFAFAGGQCHFAPADPYNGSRWYGTVLELALSAFRQPRLPLLRASKPLDLMGVSFEEVRDAIVAINAAGADAVVILHSFSLFKVRNVQYDGARPNRVVIRRFHKLCNWLAAHREQHPARTFSDLGRLLDEKSYQARAVPPCRLGPLRPLVRKAVQVCNHWYWT